MVGVKNYKQMNIWPRLGDIPGKRITILDSLPLQPLTVCPVS